MKIGKKRAAKRKNNNKKRKKPDSSDIITFNKLTQTEIKDIFISNLQSLRRKNSYTQQHFANLLNIKRARVGAWEEGRGIPPLDILYEIAYIFNTDIITLTSKELPN